MTTAEGGSEGVLLAASQPFDLVAVDHYMPGMDGLETLDQLGALPAPPPVVYVTGSDEGRIAVAALKAGAADYVVKTVGEDFFDLLTASFEQVLDRSRLAREKARAEEDLRASNARLEALLGEVNHRVANSLQLVSAMVRLQAGALADPTARAALDDTQRRIGAIAQVHRRLYSANDVESVDMRDYLGSLIEELTETLSCDSAPHSLHLAARAACLPAPVRTPRGSPAHRHASPAAYRSAPVPSRTPAPPHRRAGSRSPRHRQGRTRRWSAASAAPPAHSRPPAPRRSRNGRGCPRFRDASG